MPKNRNFVQFGCGMSAPHKWVNYDASPTLKFERLPVIGRLYTKNADRFPETTLYGDIIYGLSHPAESVDGLFASHVLEHLSAEDCHKALGNAFTILKPGRTFRLIVPCLEWRARRYLGALTQGSEKAAHDFMKSCYLGLERRRHSLLDRLQDAIGNSIHLWMWDENSMCLALKEAGVDQIRHCSYGAAVSPEFKLVEDPEKLVDSESGNLEVALEARKPY